MQNKKLLLLFFGIFIFMIIPKNVNAQCTSYRFYDSSFNLLRESACAEQNMSLQNVKYIRVATNDPYTANCTYNLNGTFNISRLNDYAWFDWSSNAGVNVGGRYVKTNPSFASTLEQRVLGSSTYYKSSYLGWSFDNSVSSATDFIQLNLQSVSTITHFNMISYNVNQISCDSTPNVDFNPVINNDNKNTSQIINNNNTNTNNIINNQNNNTQSIINNQNQNTQDTIDSQKVCTSYDKKSISIDNKYLNYAGNLVDRNTDGITKYIKVNNNSFVKKLSTPTVETGSICFYNVNKDLISCTINANQSIGQVSLPSGTSYIRFSILKTENKPQYEVCNNGNQALSDNLEDLNNNLTNSDTTGAVGSADANIQDFDVQDRGLQSLLNTIVSFIGNIANSTCTPLEFTLPFVHNEVSLPCMSTIYNTHFPTFLTLYQLITTGLIAYRVSINLFQKVKQLSDPNYDKIEVINL